MLSLWSVPGVFWDPSTAMSQAVLPSPASLSRIRWQPLPLGEALATRLASLGSSSCRNLARGLQEMGLEPWLLLLTEPAVFMCSWRFHRFIRKASSVAAEPQCPHLLIPCVVQLRLPLRLSSVNVPHTHASRMDRTCDSTLGLLVCEGQLLIFSLCPGLG